MTPIVCIVGYGMGNVRSILNAFRGIGVEAQVADIPDQLHRATHIVLPGVGAFPKGMEQLRGLGFKEELSRLVLQERRPLLGICLGMQLLATEGEEHGTCKGLGFIPGRVTRLAVNGLRIPHVGWNDTSSLRDNSLLGKAGTADCFYYVHSYRFVVENSADAVMNCIYGKPFVAGVEHQNIFGVQFHPEKSHGSGLQLLKRFTEVSGAQAPSHPLSVSTERLDRS